MYFQSAKYSSTKELSYTWKKEIQQCFLALRHLDNSTKTITVTEGKCYQPWKCINNCIDETGWKVGKSEKPYYGSVE